MRNVVSTLSCYPLTGESIPYPLGDLSYICTLIDRHYKSRVTVCHIQCSNSFSNKSTTVNAEPQDDMYP